MLISGGGYKRLRAAISAVIGTMLMGLIMGTPVAMAGNVSDPAFTTIASRMKSADIVRGDFTQEKQFSIMTRPLISKGHFVLDRRQGIWWHNDSPVPGDLVLTDAGIVQRNAAGQRQTIDSAQQPALKMMTAIIRQMIAGDWQQLSRHFEITINTIPQEWQAMLTPRTGSLFASYAKTVELKGQEHVHFIGIEEHSGDLTRISFTQLGSSTQLQPDETNAFGW